MSADVDILLVDDRPDDLLTIENVLADPSYNLVRAQSGHDALRRLLAQEFAVILVDVCMPMMDGFELATVIKQREKSRHTPIIFLTAGSSDITFIYRGYSVGAVDYLTKPIDADVLRAKVGIFVELYRKDRQIREQAEALRQSSERRYRSLTEAIPQIVWTADASGAATYLSHRWTEYTGVANQRGLGWGWLDSVAPDDVERATMRWRSGVVGERVFEIELRLRRDDGALGWHLCRAVPEEVDGVVIGWLGTFTDCDALKRAADLAERAVRARDEFLSIASHELRTPLTTLQLRLQSLEDELAGDGADPKRRHKLDSALRQSARLATLVESLLDVSRLPIMPMALQRERFDLVDVARDLVEQFDEAASSAGVTLVLRADHAAVGVWDRMRVEQIIRNLLSNAIKYAPNAPVSVGVDVREDTATVTVSDRGHGIEAADVERIFGLFERAVSPNYGGLGLGLYIARANATAHGGRIRVASPPGDGATFIVELPLQVATAA